ncbi:PRC-barrel domain-containing protein [Streptomyces sp. Pv4-95]|uniref:PRC-barrel domain-containing protein n=1 Tax=Streptomyces sp. Pv4-95 TaxID=3049543 RepID=UPI0038915681
MSSMWDYPMRIGSQGPEALVGFTVEASDGTIGQVERQVDEPGMQHLVVDTGVWVFGKSVLVPAGAVSGIDATTQTVTVAFTKDEIKAAPRFTIDSETTQLAYLTEVGNYYAALLRAGAST